MPAKWFVATYGDGGLEIEFFNDPLKYGRAVKSAKALWEKNQNGGWDCDTYTFGECIPS